MLSLLICLVSMVLLLVVFDGIMAYVTGETNKGNKIISSFITILILYSVVIYIIGNGANGGFISNGIPFASIMSKDTMLITIMHEQLGSFVIETSKLISLVFFISFIEKLLPVNNTNISLMITSRVILVLVGIIVNCFVISFVYESQIYQWALTTLQCVISGTAIIITPTMYIGQLLGISPDNAILSYAIDQLPHTAIRQAFTSAVSRTAVLMLGLMIFESECGSLSGILSLGIQLIYAIAPIIITCIGISIVIKSIFKG